MGFSVSQTSCWINEICKSLASLYSSQVTGLLLQPVTLRDIVMAPSRTNTWFPYFLLQKGGFPKPGVSAVTNLLYPHSAWGARGTERSPAVFCARRFRFKMLRYSASTHVTCSRLTDQFVREVK